LDVSHHSDPAGRASALTLSMVMDCDVRAHWEWRGRRSPVSPLSPLRRLVRRGGKFEALTRRNA